MFTRARSLDDSERLTAAHLLFNVCFICFQTQKRTVRSRPQADVAEAAELLEVVFTHLRLGCYACLLGQSSG